MKTLTNIITILLCITLVSVTILPFHMMDMADASQDHNQRIVTKEQDITNLGDRMNALVIAITQLDATLSELELTGEEPIQQERIKTAIIARYNQLDALQEQAYVLFEIPNDRYQKLLDTKQKITDEYKDAGILDDVFIDHANESIQVILHSKDYTSQRETVKTKAESFVTGKPGLLTDADFGDIQIGVKHFTESVMAGDVGCASHRPMYTSHKTQCNRFTIAFPAEKDSVDGFVTVGHAFQGALKDKADVAINHLQVYQPGPPAKSDTSLGAGLVPPGALLMNPYWQAQIIGKLDYGSYSVKNGLDTAFVKLLPYKTIDKTIKVFDNIYDIVSYRTSDPVIGQYVYKTGISSGTTFGYIKSGDNIDGVYASYAECGGDSGSPVGSLLASGSTIEYVFYGMHLGRTTIDDTEFTQSSCNGLNAYSKFMKYSEIKIQLDIDEQTQ